MRRQSPIFPRGFLTCFLCLFAVPAFGQDLDGSADHPLLSRFPGSTIVAYDQRTHDQTFIPTQADLESGNWVAGRVTWIAYQAPDNSSVLQLYRNYEKALMNAGFETAFTCRKAACGQNFVRNLLQVTGRYISNYDRWIPGTISYLAARLPSESGDVWVSLAIYDSDQQGKPIVRQEIVESNSPRPLKALSASNIGSKIVEFDEVKLAAGAGDSRKIADVLELEGKLGWNVLRYAADVSPYEAFASWAKLATDNGAQFDFSCARQRCGSGFIRGFLDLNGLIAEGGEQWSQDSGYYFLARSSAAGKAAYLSVLTYRQPDGMTVSHSLDVVTDTPDFDEIVVNADALATQIEKTGRVAVYGIYFDTDKADLKPDSAPTLAQIARLLELRPGLSLFVDGHTDSQAGEDYNLSLSRRRSAAVVNALVANYGIARERLEARGFGATDPVDTNATEEGRAKNRRVELVGKTSR